MAGLLLGKKVETVGQRTRSSKGMVTVTRKHTKCRRCTAPYDAHKGEKLKCPDGSGRVFIKHAPRMAPSQSFTEGEIAVLDFIMSTLLRGGTPAMAMRHKDFAGVARKTMAMKKRAAEMKTERVEYEKQEREQEQRDEGGSATGQG